MASRAVKSSANQKTVSGGGRVEGDGEPLNLSEDVLQELKRQSIVSILDLPAKVRRGWKIPKSENQRGLACEVCGRALTLKQVKDHVQSKSHQLKHKDHELHQLLPTLSKPSPAYFESLTSFLTDTFNQHTAVSQLKQRQDIAEELQQCLKENGLDVSVTLFGSNGTGFALTSSNVNINISIAGATENQSLISKCMKSIALCLNKRGELYVKVKEDYSSFNKIPRILFSHRHSGLHCEIRAEAGNPVALCSLMKLYADIDIRCVQLAVLFRLWAKICSVDRQEDGHYPGHMFVLMVIHYLQQIGVLPVLHELHNCRLKAGRHDKKKQKGKESDASQPGTEGEEHTDEESRVGEEEGGGTEEAVEGEDDDEGVVFEEEVEEEGGDVGREEQGKKKEESMSRAKEYVIDYLDNLAELPRHWTDTNTQSLGELWYHMLRYYAVEFKIAEHAVSIRQKTMILRDKRQWGETRLAVEDPLIPKSNVGRAAASQQVFQYLMSSLRLTALYFSGYSDQRPYKLLYGTAKVKSNIHKQDASAKQDPSIEWIEAQVSNTQDQATKPLSLNKAHEEIQPADHGKQESDCIEFQDSSIVFASVKQTAGSTDTSATSVKHDVQETNSDDEQSRCDLPSTSVSKLTITDPTFKFDPKEFVFHPYPVSCLNCKKLKHSILECPEIDLASEYRKILPKHHPDAASLQRIHICFANNMTLQMPDEAHMANRWRIIESILRDIHVLYPCAQLEMFGSSANGFGSRNSDLDICLILPGHDKDARGKIIELIANELAKNRRKYDQVIAITSARVPIVKFYMREWMIQCDISLENKLALQNTKMLAAYSRIDSRVPELGCALKRLAKSCDVCDAATGSLSSYAYILMLLHFLQRVTPPVIPVLQQLRPADVPRQEHVIDEWDCYYYEFKSTADLMNVWSGYGANNSSTGELWLGMLRYYTTKFDWNENVVTIKQLSPLSKFDKWWIGKCMCVEDPFNLDHNLGGGITNKMRAYILDRFMDALRYHSENIHWRSIEELMDPVALKGETRPPKFMRCYNCGSRSHKATECPDKANQGRQIKPSQKTIQEQRDTPSNKKQNDTKAQERIIYNAPVQGNRKRNKSKGHTPHHSNPMMSPHPFTNQTLPPQPHLQSPPYQARPPQSILPTPYLPGFPCQGYSANPSIPYQPQGNVPMAPSMNVAYSPPTSYPMHPHNVQMVSRPRHASVLLPHSVGRSPPYRQYEHTPQPTTLFQPPPASCVYTPTSGYPENYRREHNPPMSYNPRLQTRNAPTPPAYYQLPYSPTQEGPKDRSKTRDQY